MSAITVMHSCAEQGVLWLHYSERNTPHATLRSHEAYCLKCFPSVI